MTSEHEARFLAAIELAARARKNGNEPFGALLVDGYGNPVLGLRTRSSPDRITPATPRRT